MTGEGTGLCVWVMMGVSEEVLVDADDDDRLQRSTDSFLSSLLSSSCLSRPGPCTAQSRLTE